MDDYRVPSLHRHPHFSTVVPNLFRKLNTLSFERKTFETPDEDFFDVDVYAVRSKTAGILLHGLEGSSHSRYMLGMTKALNDAGMDAVSINHRSCGGRMNKLFSSYHSGFTQDLAYLIPRLKEYDELVLIGFSLGGNIVLKYLGTVGKLVDTRIKSAIAVSVPMHLASSAVRLSKADNWIYLQRFLRPLKQKALDKARAHPDWKIDTKAIKRVRSFHEFDEVYTAPAHGFMNASDYYERSSSLYTLSNIHVPTLIINAQNDTFLTPENFPHEDVAYNDFLTMLTPVSGGHVGFASDNFMKGSFWHEKQALRFIGENISSKTTI